MASGVVGSAQVQVEGPVHDRLWVEVGGVLGKGPAGRLQAPVGPLGVEVGELGGREGRADAPAQLVADGADGAQRPLPVGRARELAQPRVALFPLIERVGEG